LSAVYFETNEEHVRTDNIREIKYLELLKKWLIFTLYFFTLEIPFIWEILIKPSLYFPFPFLLKLQIRSFLGAFAKMAVVEWENLTTVPSFSDLTLVYSDFKCICCQHLQKELETALL